ncbi:MAG: TRAP transporter small permease [Alphaproteobacteria bacterium]|nr:MAG: TRAP transporter small permease [Alphaproteobacteria bacterium]
MQSFAGFVTALARIAAAAFVAAGLMLTYDVLARYFLVRPTIWAAELSQACLIWGTLIAAPWCLRERHHIRITAAVELMPPGARRAAEVLSMLAVALFAAVVLIYGWDIFWDSFRRGRTTGSMLDLPVWIVELAVPFGMAVLLVQALIEAAGAARGLGTERGGERP